MPRSSSRATLHLAVLLASPVLLAGCEGSDAAASPLDAAPPASASAPSARPSASSASSAAADQQLQILKLVFTSEVKNREPTDKLESAQPGQRVYAHVTFRNRTGKARPVSLAFLVNGSQRSRIDLDVEPSWSYRTWGYNTLRAGDAGGELTVEIRDDAGTLIGSARLPIHGDPAKPQGSKPTSTAAFDD